jgi:hypothetical protein
MMNTLPSSVLRLLQALIAGAAFIGPFAVPAAALDFQLHTVSINEDGYMHKHSCFKYDERTDVMIDFPVGWSTTADAGSITSLPPHEANTSIFLQRSPLTPDTPFKDSGLDTYRKRATAMIPPGAVNLHVIKETAEPLPVFGWKDFEFEMTYDFFGATFRRSVLFVDVDASQQILTTVVAEQPNFDKVHAAAMDVMRSWCPVPPSY